MKIAIDARVLMDKYYSGVSVFTSNLLDELLKIDKSNTYSFFYNSFKKIKNNRFDNKNTVQTFCPNKFFNYVLQKNFSWPKLDKLMDRPGVFYMPHINFASLSNECKKLITIHDLSFLRYPEFFSYRKNFWHKSLNLKSNLNKFDKIIAVSNNTKNDIIELLKIKESKIEVIYPGINYFKQDFLYNRAYLEERYKINKKYILYLGTIEPRKNISKLITAYNQLRDTGDDYLLVLAGSWGWRTREIRNEWQKSKYKNDIIFTGYIKDEEKSVFYQNAELFVYPSLYEGFGFPPLEAMKFGTPVISSNSSSLPEVLSDSALLINSDKEGELFEAMKLVLNDVNLRNSLISKGKDRINNFSWAKTAQKYLELFNNL